MFIHCVYDYLECEYLPFHLHNESSVIEHQFTNGGLFDFVYCAHNLLLGHACRVVGGSRSVGIVVQGAVRIYIRLSERYFFALQVGLSTGDRDRQRISFFLCLYSVRLYHSNLLTHQVHH